MAGDTRRGSGWQGSPLQKAMWGGAAAFLLFPAVAMHFTTEVHWTASDFVLMGLLLGVACGAVEAGMRLSDHLAYRAGVVAAVGGGFLLVWVNLAVGLIGDEDHPANRMYLGVLATGLVGALLARFRARGMMRSMLAMAAAQVLVPMVAVLARGTDPASPAPELVGATLVFLVPWLLAAALFRLAAAATSNRQRSQA